MSSQPYYVWSTSGIGTNLQLFSLHKAWELWSDTRSRKDQLSESRMRERCVVTVSLLGLSLSQLLGQNYPAQGGRLPSPGALLSGVLGPTASEPRFNEFLKYYDDCRHFGPSKHHVIDTLDLKKTESFVDLACEIWDEVLKKFRAGRENQLEIESIRKKLDEGWATEEDLNIRDEPY